MLFTQVRRSSAHLYAIYASPARYALFVRNFCKSGALWPICTLFTQVWLEPICTLVTQVWRSSVHLYAIYHVWRSRAHLYAIYAGLAL